MASVTALLACASSVQGISFRAAPTYQVGHNPEAIATADFNGDTLADLAVANVGTISILLNNGVGGFAAAATYNSNGPLSSIVVADFNGDDKLDLAATRPGTLPGVVLLLGDGAGGFGPAVGQPAGLYAVALAAGDFNGDDNADLAVVDQQSAQIDILIGDGSGGFASPVTYDVGQTPWFVAVGDLNGDGKLDIAVCAGATNSGVVSILLGDGAGALSSFGNHAVGDNPRSIALRDFNGDTTLDLAVANAASANVSVLLGDGAGQFGSTSNYNGARNPISIVAADFDGDGRLDLALGNYDDGVSLLLGNGSGSFVSAGTTFTAGTGVHVAVADFTGDGRLDIAASSTYSDRVSLLVGDGAGALTAAPSFATGDGVPSLVTGDFNQDGKPDVAAFGVDASLLLGNGNGTFALARHFGAGVEPRGASSGDFNNDGKLDLVAANPNEQRFTVLLGDGSGGFGPAANHSVPGVPQSTAVADFNGDDHADLAIANGGSGPNVLILLGDGAGDFGPPVTYGAGENPWALVVGDFNADSKPDLAVANYFSSKVTTLLGDGTGAFTLATSRDVGQGPVAIAVGDLNGDGKLDVATANGNIGPNTLSVLFGDGLGGLTSATHYFSGSYARSIVVHDFDGGGSLDLAVANGNNASDDVSILVGDGAGNFGPAINFGVGTLPFSLGVADFNQDGRSDLAVASFAGRDIALLLNDPVVANLSVKVDDSQVDAVPGESISYTITVKNHGPDGTVGAPVLYTPPSALKGVTWSCSASPGSSCAASGSGNISDTVDLLSAGTATYVVNGTIDPKALSCFLSNAASVEVPQGVLDPAHANNQGTDVDALVPSISIRGNRVREGSSGSRSVSVLVRLSKLSCQAVTVAYATSNGTAIAGSDYVATSGTLTFRPLARARPVIISLMGDKIAEGNESFFVDLTAPTHAVLSTARAKVTIVDDDRN